MSDIFLCCVKHGLVGYIIGVVFILVIRIIQTNDFAYGNSYTKKHIIEEYIYDIKMSTVEGIVGLIVGLVVGVVFECCEIIGYAIVYNAWNEIPLSIVSAIVAVSSMALFLSAFEWEKIQGRRLNFGKLSVLLLCLFVFPVCSYVYKSHDMDDMSFRLYVAGERSLGIEFYNDEGLAYRVRVSDPAVVNGLLQNTESGECRECSLRVKSSFRKVLQVEFIYSHDTGKYFDDRVRIKFPDGCRTSLFDNGVKNLRW